MRDRYWHNMASRIQRAWRNYLRYRNECAARIQRFWKNNKEAIEYAKVRDRGHQLLAGRKERRRFSLLGSRRFLGDYLDVNGQDPFGEVLKNACGLGCEFFNGSLAPSLILIRVHSQPRKSSSARGYSCSSRN